jgi:magnesium-transporting ATPase (P-type)
MKPESVSDAVTRGPAYWSGRSAEAALAELGTNPDGLATVEARARLARLGPNVLPRGRRRRWYHDLAAQFFHLLAILLWVAAGLAWLAGMPQLTVAIIIVIVVNGLFSFWQEYQAERAIEALEALLPRRVTVRRGGEELQIPAAEVVSGDLLVLSEGDAVPADARVVTSERLLVDTASLTGESRPVPRTAQTVSREQGTPAELPNLVLMGTSVSSGRGLAVVFATGAATEFGRIAHLTAAQAERSSPLQREINFVTHVVTVLSVALGVICFALGTTIGGLTAAAGFLFAVGIIVANIPEGLLPTLTLALALGVRRMARRHALVKRLSAVEALGAATVILTDKTGTLTENEMTVREVWAGGASYRLTGAGYGTDGEIEPLTEACAPSEPLAELLRTAALCCDARLMAPGDGTPRWSVIGDPTEAAILVAASKAGLTAGQLTAWPRLAELPFDSIRKRMTTIQEINGRPVACVKGAPSEVLPRCIAMHCASDLLSPDGDWRTAAEATNDALARRGLRVLAIATRPLEGIPSADPNPWVEEVERNLTLLGLVATEDPPRSEVPAAIADCRRAGIRVVMVTGDDGRTAAAIAREIGLHDQEPAVITGAALERMTDQDLERQIASGAVLFARVTPEHKLRLVQAFQRQGHIVAVTGDGVNDAPALKRADIGVAMGITGTDVAREASDMVLADDNFASIVAAIEEGRAVYENVRKFLTYVLVSNVAEAVPFAAFILYRIPLPLTVMQVLAVDVGTDLFPALGLGTEPPEPGLMSRPPRSRHQRLLNAPTLLRTYCWLGAIEAVLALAGFFAAYWIAGWRPGQPMEEAGPLYLVATSMTFAGIVAAQIGNAFACRSARETVLRLGLTTNRALLIGIAIELGILLTLLYVPPIAVVFGMAPLDPRHWLLLAAFGPALLALEEGRKALVRRISRAC